MNFRKGFRVVVVAIMAEMGFYLPSMPSQQVMIVKKTFFSVSLLVCLINKTTHFSQPPSTFCH